jgi:tetratricopeptide (TPR) repeat protein
MHRAFQISNEDSVFSSDSALESVIIKQNQIAMSNLESGHASHVIFYLNQALLACMSLPRSEYNERLLALTYNNLACYFQRIKESNKALEFLFKAVNLMWADRDAVNLSAAHLNICTILTEREEYERALRHALKCIYILRNRDCFSLSLVKAYFAAGNLYKKLRQLADAKECFKKGYLVSKANLGKKNKLTEKLYQSENEVRIKEMKRKEIRNVRRNLTPVLYKSYKSTTETKQNSSVNTSLNKDSRTSYVKPSFKSSFRKTRPRIDITLQRAQEKYAATKIQSIWRGYQARKRIKNILLSSVPPKFKSEFSQTTGKLIKYQKNAQKSYKKFQKTKNTSLSSLVKIQSAVRMFIAKQRYKRVLSACLKIQRFFKIKGYSFLYEKSCSALNYIQFMFRKYKSNIKEKSA